MNSFLWYIDLCVVPLLIWNGQFLCSLMKWLWPTIAVYEQWTHNKDLEWWYNTTCEVTPHTLVCNGQITRWQIEQALQPSSWTPCAAFGTHRLTPERPLNTWERKVLQLLERGVNYGTPKAGAPPPRSESEWGHVAAFWSTLVWWPPPHTHTSARTHRVKLQHLYKKL